MIVGQVNCVECGWTTPVTQGELDTVHQFPYVECDNPRCVDEHGRRHTIDITDPGRWVTPPTIPYQVR